MELRVGQRYSSVVDDTSVMVTRAPSGDVVLACGGVPMVEGSHEGDKDSSRIDADLRDGTEIGKRYADSGGGIELMCVKPGVGTLTLDGAALDIKAAKQLPSSD
jgi:hypothetical protein